jgi:hypothetical protein
MKIKISDQKKGHAEFHIISVGARLTDGWPWVLRRRISYKTWKVNSVLGTDNSETLLHGMPSNSFVSSQVFK